MNELEISINGESEQSEKELRAVIGNFEEQNRTKLTCSLHTWGNAWAELMKTVLYKHGPCMAQVGSTWLGSLESTQALRIFKPLEINQMGGVGSYHPSVWKSVMANDTDEIIAVPWFVDTYLIYYRKDLLKKAGIDESTAFESYEALEETVQKIAQTDIPIPLALPTKFASRANLHNLACWVWNHGGDFVSEDGSKLLLSDPKTQQGFKAYFSLHQYTPKAAQQFTDLDCQQAFLDGTAAITIRNANLIYVARRDPAFANHLSDMGVAAMPGQNFVGGSSFVLWNHISLFEEQTSIALLKKLALPETQYAYFQQNGFLPARLEALTKVEEDPFYIPVVQALMRGRSLRKIKLWGLIEERLSNAILQIWQTLYANPNANVDEEIAKVIEPLERRLQLTLSNQ